jgi:hypothetical protein
VIEPFRLTVDVLLSQPAKTATQIKGCMAFIYIPPCAANARGRGGLPKRCVQAVAFVSDRRHYRYQLPSV